MNNIRTIILSSLLLILTTSFGCSSSGEFVSSGLPVFVGGGAQFKFLAENVEFSDISFSTNTSSSSVQLVDECQCDRSYWRVASVEEGPVEVTASFPDGNRASMVFDFINPDLELVNAGSPSAPLGSHLMEGTRVELVATLDGEIVEAMEGTENLRFTSSWDLDAFSCYDPMRAFSLRRSSLGAFFDRDGKAEGYIGYSIGETTFRQDVVVYDANSAVQSIEVVRDELTGALMLQGITEDGETITGLRGEWSGVGDPVAGVSIASEGEVGEVIVRYQGREARVNTGVTLTATPFFCSSQERRIFGECGLDIDFGFCAP